LESFVAIAKKILSLVGRLLILVIFVLAFLAGMIGAIWYSLRGEEIKVPEIVGKDFYEGEKELASLGLKIKRRAYRYSNEKPNTILEQAPRPGETVKTGQTILVVLAQPNPESTEAPATVKREEDEEEASTSNSTEDSKKNRNANVKKLEKTRDVISNKSQNSNLNVKVDDQNSNKVSGESKTSSENKNSESKPSNVEPKPAKSPSVKKTPTPPTGDVRNRRVIP
jgi:hypothetical protein